MNSCPAYKGGKSWQHAPIAVQLISTTDQYMERTHFMFRKKVHPYWVVSCLEAWSTEIIRVHSSAKAIALGRTSSAQRTKMATKHQTHRVNCKPHSMIFPRNEEIQLNTMVDAIPNLLLIIREWDLDEEPPKSIRPAALPQPTHSPCTPSKEQSLDKMCAPSIPDIGPNFLPRYGLFARLRTLVPLSILHRILREI